MPKLIRRAGLPQGSRKAVTLTGFPRHWLPIFELAGARWKGSSSPDLYVPFVSGLTQQELVKEIRSAQKAGQLRVLVESIAGCDPVIAEVLPRIDVHAKQPPAALLGEARIR